MSEKSPDQTTDPLLEPIARAICRAALNERAPQGKVNEVYEDQSYLYLACARAAIGTIYAAGYQIMPCEVIPE